MPKLLEMVREKALEKAREILLGPDGYEALTMRSVASALSVGVGTLYNYFPSKEHLIASVMLEDWQKAGAALEERLRTLPPGEGLRAVYALIEDFARLYTPVWSAAASRTQEHRRRYHSALVEQIRGYLAALDAGGDVEAQRFAAEMLLYFASSGGHTFESVEPYLRKLIEIKQ